MRVGILREGCIVGFVVIGMKWVGNGRIFFWKVNRRIISIFIYDE